MMKHKAILLILLMFISIATSYAEEDPFKWGESRENILKTSTLIPNEESWGLTYKDQKAFKQNCHISYFFNDNKLWKIRLSFTSNSDKNVDFLRKKLTAIYGEVPKKDVWKFNLTDILLKRDKNFIYVFYQNSSVAETIKQQNLQKYSSDL